MPLPETACGIPLENLLALLFGNVKTTNITPGTYNDIDETFSINIKGNVKKGEDVSYTPTISIPLKQTLALLLSRMGFQRERAKNILVQVMTEVITAKQQNRQPTQSLLDFVADIDAAEQEVTELLGQLPKDTKTGPTTKNLVVFAEILQPV